MAHLSCKLTKQAGTVILREAGGYLTGSKGDHLRLCGDKDFIMNRRYACVRGVPFTKVRAVRRGSAHNVERDGLRGSISFGHRVVRSGGDMDSGRHVKGGLCQWIVTFDVSYSVQFSAFLKT